MHQATPSTDWTGVEPDQSPVQRLDAHTFAARLRLLSDRAEGLTTLRKAFNEQHPRDEQLPQRPQPAPRPSR